MPFAGENFVRHTGESREFAKAQVFAWDAMDKGVDVHPQANPTQLAVLRKSYTTKKVNYFLLILLQSLTSILLKHYTHT